MDTPAFYVQEDIRRCYANLVVHLLRRTSSGKISWEVAHRRDVGEQDVAIYYTKIRGVHFIIHRGQVQGVDSVIIKARSSDHFIAFCSPVPELIAEIEKSKPRRVSLQEQEARAKDNVVGIMVRLAF